MASDRHHPLVTGAPAPGRLFTTWFTSTVDGRDHAVTDEEFAEHRPEPEAVCGVVVVFGPMELAPGPHCRRCVAFLSARESLRGLNERLGVHRYRRGGWLGRLLHGTLLSPVVPHPRARHDRPEPPADLPRQVSAGLDSSAVAWPPQAAAEETSTASAPAASCQPPSGAGAHGSTAVTGRAVALSPTHPTGRQGTQTPVDAACSPAAASTGHHDGTRGTR